ncbi:MAG: single-stranded-DNA-specific exonuclease RecJ [Clostridiales bacterium]|nr:single-stranded-DNA-specific exonuclease RecJ [Clostridiales bacterium]
MTRNSIWHIEQDASALGVQSIPPLGLMPLTAALLRLRGISTTEDQLDFLRQKKLEDLSDFWRLPDMAAGVKAVRQAVESGKRIWIYGDYDADGITATALLWKTFAMLGCKADYYIPDRLREGYGLHMEAISYIKEQGAEFLITVDCGISSVEEAALAKSLGIPMVITDHHRPPQVLPEALAIINPELMETPGASRGMAGAGVAFAFSRCLLQDFGHEEDGRDLLQLAAIGTLADGMPLAGDNRILTSLGLDRMNRSPLPGIRAMAVQGGLEGKTIRENHISFQFAPRLNAAGRLDDPTLGLQLLLAEDLPSAHPYVTRLAAINQQRQEWEGRINREIASRLEDDPAQVAGPVLILAGEDWHPGVIGICAARLTDKYQKPALLVSFTNDTGRGSGRSLPGYPIYQALSQAASLLPAFGGHALACGFQIHRKDLDSLRRIIEDYALQHWAEAQAETEASRRADLQVAIEQLTPAAMEDLERLAPFGAENPRPILVLPAMRLAELRPMGKEKRHFQLFFQTSQRQGKRQSLMAIAFSMEDTIFFPETGKCYDLLFSPEMNEWQGRTSVQILLKDLRLSEGETEAEESGDREAEPGETGPVDWEAYRSSILGDHAYREKQIDALNALSAGKNTLLLMATGRGKTAVFQTAIAALGKEKISIVLYPLRSLARDQMNRMEKVLQPLGIQSFLAWGGLDHWEKRAFFNNLYQGRIQLVISTAEFLQSHLDKFVPVAERIGLFVVDEAHHLGSGNRQSYKDLQKTWEKLGRPLFLGTTATAEDACADKILRDFKIGALVAEEHCRENLALQDARGGSREEKLAYLLQAIRQDRKMIIYVNSRALTEELSRTLQDNLPWMKNTIGYYHGGLLPEERQEAEKAFLSGAYRVLVSTSAFGEGADIPDIRDVALYHLCFSEAEYNQLSGRAGRDGQSAFIHLLYDQKDLELNRLLLREEAPDRSRLGSFYLLLREKAARANPLEIADEILAAEMRKRGFDGFTAVTARYCLGILEEIALLLREEENGRRLIHLAPPPPAKLDLNQSSLYREGKKNTILFEEYAVFAFSSDLSALLAGINRPILPERRRSLDG